MDGRTEVRAGPLADEEAGQLQVGAVPVPDSLPSRVPRADSVPGRGPVPVVAGAGSAHPARPVQGPFRRRTPGRPLAAGRAAGPAEGVRLIFGRVILGRVHGTTLGRV
ncbi:hypothetical protein GCM10012287_45290 [Streptomyces daqingensis]|uniref:Uncharacterized protein n=1 Tax=Streptomyces daqingensis TaxID=1472640 RepID=A0ABQ2MNF7_9ACTN|nr:hypothetical protein GCM10012287_45290 [Streptomyces daqingensis]